MDGVCHKCHGDWRKHPDIQLPNSTEYKHNISEHISFDIVTLDLADMAQAQLALTFQPARGKFCSEASLEYVDATEKVVDNIELFYNEPEHLFSMIMDFQADHDLPFLANSSSVTGSARVVHDFGYGLQYTLSRDGRACKGVHPIDSQMVMCIQHDDYYYAGKVVSEEGVVLDAYVTKTAETQDGRTVLEMLYYSDKANHLCSTPSFSTMR
uniref:LolA-like domain-containing protein n=1 Tax=Ditylenchus dipsaci TaxID=166011 RepID=A0A915ERX1_9BILA